MIDTGAEVSLVSEKVIEKINPKPKLSRRKVALQSVSGEALFVKGSTDLEFKVGNQKCVHTFQVVRGLNRNFILGTDWMSKNGVRIYFDLQKLRVGNLYVPYEQDIHYCVFIESQQNNGPEASDSTDLSGKDEGRSIH